MVTLLQFVDFVQVVGIASFNFPFREFRPLQATTDFQLCVQGEVLASGASPKDFTTRHEGRLAAHTSEAASPTGSKSAECDRVPRLYSEPDQHTSIISYPSFLGLEGGVDLGKRELRRVLFVELATWVYPNTISFHTGPGGYARSNAS